MKKLVILSIFFCVCSHSFAQTHDIKFDHIGIKEGLPEQQARSIFQDTEGYIWIGTQNGLVRYDGYNYKIYQLGSAKLNRIVNTSIRSIFEDRGKNLWVGTIDNGWFRYNRNNDNFQQFIYPKGSRVFNISVQDSDDNLWGVNQDDNAGVAKFNISTGSFEVFNSSKNGLHKINAVTFYSIFKSHEGFIWTATSNGLYRYNGNGKGFKAYFFSNDTAKTEAFYPVYEASSEPGVFWANTFHGNNLNLKLTRFDYRKNTVIDYSPGTKKGELANTDIFAIHEDKKRQLWFAINAGVAKLDRHTGLFTNYLKKDKEKNTFLDFTETPSGNFWLSTALGIVYFNTTSGEFKLYDGADDPGSARTKMVDNTGQLWVGSFGGVYKTNYLKSAFHILKSTPGNVNGYPGGSSAIIAADDDSYWTFTNSCIYKWTPAANLFKKILKTDLLKCFSMCQDNGLIYISSEKGVSVFNTLTKKQETLTNDAAEQRFLNNALINVIYRDHLGMIWMGSSRQGITAYDPKTKKFKHYPFKNGNGLGDDQNDGRIDDYTILSITEDREHVLWVGTNGGGLNKFDRATGKFYSYHTKKNHDMFCVISIHEDKAGRFWVGTYLNGLYEFDKTSGKILRNIKEENGLLHNEVIAIDEDNSGHLILPTARGITRYDPISGKIQNFKAGTILPGEDIVFPNDLQGESLAGNSIAISLNDGVMEFNPQSLAPNTTVPIVHINGLTYSDPNSSSPGVNINPYNLKKIELAYNQNRITFDYIGLHFDDPSQNQYAYKLDGYDNDWVQAGTVRTVTYTNLSPGNYTFHVRASNADGIWNNKGESITIIIYTSLWMRWWAWLIYLLLFAGAIYGFITYRSRALKRENQVLEENINRRTQQLSKANKELSEQQEEIITQRDRLTETVNELKATQTQLIQSEKLASLGELTAGIAHEIQNPLNFVNNFSEVNIELIEEMRQEMDKGDYDEAKAIAGDIKDNQLKIIHHGKRADGIVKNMLQHSRNNSGEKEPTDINTLADEYFRLSYHGLRAKDKSFNSEMATDFDPALPKINVIPQDIGRVMLNLFNNAFYAVQQKNIANEDYKPIVTVSTKWRGKFVEIKVADNGIGMHPEVKEKILQPFFTTKPTGEGTGLGLSLSYDIVVKTHGGKIDINSTYGRGSEFIITLPLV